MRMASLLALLLGAAPSLGCGVNVIGGAGGGSQVTTTVSESGPTASDSSPPPPVCPGAGYPVVMESPGCGCTRRTGASASCPAGAGANVTVNIGPSGGSIALMGNQGPASGVSAELDFPAMALSSDTAVTLTETSIPPPFDYEDLSPVWAVSPLALPLHTQAQMKLPDSGNGSSITLQPAVYWSADGCSWSPLADSYDNAGFMNASTLALGYFFVGVPKPPSQATCP